MQCVSVADFENESGFLVNLRKYISLKTTIKLFRELPDKFRSEVWPFLRFLHERHSRFSIVKRFEGYRHIRMIICCTIDDEEQTFAISNALNVVERSWSHYRLHPILFRAACIVSNIECCDRKLLVTTEGLLCKSYAHWQKGPLRTRHP